LPRGGIFAPPEIFWSILEIAGITIAATSVLFVQPLKARWVEASTELVQRGKTFALPLLERAFEFVGNYEHPQWHGASWAVAVTDESKSLRFEVRRDCGMMRVALL